MLEVVAYKNEDANR